MTEPLAEIAAAARHVVRAAGTATLATTMTPVPGGGPGDEPAGAGGPCASLALLAADHTGAPILLVSTLAEHTRNLSADPRVSILCDGTLGCDSPLTGPRVTLQGRLAPAADPQHRSQFLARHADAAGYVDFSDFAFFRLDVSSAHMVEGFGRIHWIGGADLLLDVART